MAALRILTWNVRPDYLVNLAATPHVFVLPVDPARSEAYRGRSDGYGWPDNVTEVPVADLPRTQLDCVLFQSKRHYLSDQYEILTPAQLKLPRLYLEHDPPRDHPTDAKHPVRDESTLLVHTGYYNQLMWDSGDTPTQVIEPAIVVPRGLRATWSEGRGVVVVDEIRRHGRRMGEDLWDKARGEVPLDLFGAGWKDDGGLGALDPPELVYTLARYRFFFHTARQATFSPALMTAMALGLPIVATATGDLSALIQNGVTGYVSNDQRYLVESMRELIRDLGMARRLGGAAREVACERFDIRRFASEWDLTLRRVAGGVGRRTTAWDAAPRWELESR